MTDDVTRGGTRSEILNARARKTILWANITMIAMIVLHDSDHVRQAANWCYTISAQLWLVNVSVYVPSLIALALLWRGKGAGVALTALVGALVSAAGAYALGLQWAAR